MKNSNGNPASKKNKGKRITSLKFQTNIRLKKKKSTCCWKKKFFHLICTQTIFPVPPTNPSVGDKSPVIYSSWKTKCCWPRRPIPAVHRNLHSSATFDWNLDFIRKLAKMSRRHFRWQSFGSHRDFSDVFPFIFSANPWWRTCDLFFLFVVERRRLYAQESVYIYACLQTHIHVFVIACKMRVCHATTLHLLL